MASNTLVKRLLWIYSVFTLYLLVASLLGILGMLTLPLSMNISLLSAWLALYWVWVIVPRLIKRRQKQPMPA
jgi:hypothetical protein